MPAWARARPTARFVTDVTVPDGTVLAPSTPFVKTWRLSNEGSCAFGGPAADVRLVNVGGDLMGGPAEGVAVSDVQRPGAQFDVSLPLVAPARAGRYIGYWRMLSDGDTAWGHRLWVDIVVEESPETAAAAAAREEHDVDSFGPDAGSGAASPPDAGAQSGKSPAATEDDWSAELSLLANMGFDDMDRILQLLT
ncbi:unnamed protein product, partial [Phaeothamnion confervicola]